MKTVAVTMTVTIGIGVVAHYTVSVLKRDKGTCTMHFTFENNQLIYSYSEVGMK